MGCNSKEIINQGANEMTKKTIEGMKQELELHLHEQYAINNNANLSSIMTFFVGMLAAIGAYGYVFLYSANYFGELLPNTNDNIKYSLTQLTYALVGAEFVINVLICICLYQGMAQRLEQFITYAIRDKYDFKTIVNNTDDKKDGIVPENYHPFEKHGLKAIQGLYGEFVKILGATMIFLFLSYALKLGYHIYSYNSYGLDCKAVVLVVIGVFCCFLFGIASLKCYSHLQRKYDRRSKEYSKTAKEKNNSKNEDDKKFLLFLRWIPKSFGLIFKLGK